MKQDKQSSAVKMLALDNELKKFRIKELEQQVAELQAQIAAPSAAHVQPASQINDVVNMVQPASKPEEFAPYDAIFSAIRNATEVQAGKAITVSVVKFKESLAESGYGVTRCATSKEASKPNNYHDAYRGARDDLQIWKKRALEAEESCRRLVKALNDENGPMHMGEPVVSKEASDHIGDANEMVAAWEPKFEAIVHEQEQLAIKFCEEIAGRNGRPGSPPDPVRLLEMAEALYLAERKEASAPARDDVLHPLPRPKYWWEPTCESGFPPSLACWSHNAAPEIADRNWTVTDYFTGDQMREYAKAALRTQQATAPEAGKAGGQIPEGWKLVPVEPTFAMTESGHDAGLASVMSLPLAKTIYAAMLSAAPAAQSAPVQAVTLTDEEIDAAIDSMPGLIDCLLDPYDAQKNGCHYSSLYVDIRRLVRRLLAGSAKTGEAG